MTFDQVIEFYGSQANLARAIGCTRQNIARWRHDGVPLVRQYQIEEITGGKLKRNKRPARGPNRLDAAG